MSDFVERCRREWQRLHVPDPVAEEMAADLAADLNEAEAEGISAEEVLGSSVFDPPSFAAAWAAERGVIPPPPAPQTQRLPRKPLTLGAIAALVVAVLFLVVLFGAALITRAAPPTVNVARGAPPPFRQLLPGQLQPLTVHAHRSVGAAPLLVLLLLLAIIAIAITWLWSARTRPRPPDWQR
jgi:amino acid transporter